MEERKSCRVAPMGVGMARPRTGSSVQLAWRGLFSVAVLLLSYWVLCSLDSWAYQKMGAHQLAMAANHLFTKSRWSSGRDASRARAQAVAHEPVGRIVIPRLAVCAIISEGIDPGTLRHAVGHIPDTPFPGEGGNFGLAAHRDSFFRGLKDAQVGDSIRVETLDGIYHYQVDSILIVDPDRYGVLEATTRPSLTLVTCYPFHFIGHAPKRFVVRAREIGIDGTGSDSPVDG